MSEPAHPVTPSKPSRIDGTSRADTYAEDLYRLSDEEEGIGAKKIRPPRHVLKYEVFMCWVTGDRAELDEDVIQTELKDLMCEYMELSGQRKVFGHRSNPTDKGLWKLARSHTDKRGIRYDVYRCPLRDRCGCLISLRIMTILLSSSDTGSMIGTAMTTINPKN